MKRILLYAACSSLALTGCNRFSAPDQPTVIIDGWWDVDYAKAECRDSGDVCEATNAQAARDFDTELFTQFASLPDCHGVNVLHFKSPKDTSPAMGAATDNKKSWMISVSLQLDNTEQPWSMTTREMSSPLYQGTDNAPAIAKRVCAIVKGAGATGSN
jgi:hypothetical protein